MGQGLGYILLFWIAFISLGMGVLWIWRARFSPQTKMMRRIDALGHSLIPTDIGVGDPHIRRKLIQGKLRELENQRRKSQSNRISQLILQSGISITVRQYLGISIFSGFVVGIILWLCGLSLLAFVTGAIAGGVALPRWVLMRIIKRRQKKFVTYFADAIDILVRGTRSGLPVGECLQIVARDSPDPIGPEFQLLTESQRVGMTLKQALARSLERMPVTDFQFFSIILLIQQQTGGNLAATLENLSTILRARKRFNDKVSALSAEAKASAAIIGSLPFLVGAALLLVNPDYMGLLFTEGLGKIMLTFAMIWMLFGIFVMHQMIKFDR